MHGKEHTTSTTFGAIPSFYGVGDHLFFPFPSPKRESFTVFVNMSFLPQTNGYAGGTIQGNSNWSLVNGLIYSVCIRDLSRKSGLMFLRAFMLEDASDSRRRAKCDLHSTIVLI